MSGIIHDGNQKKYDCQLSRVTEHKKVTILEAKTLHENNEVDHHQQCSMIPVNEEFKKWYYHLNSCYNKFTMILQHVSLVRHLSLH